MAEENGIRLEDGLDPEELRALLRVAGTATWHTAQFGVQAYLRTGRLLVRAVTPEPALEAARQVEQAARAVAVSTGLAQRVQDVTESNELLGFASRALRDLVGGTPTLASRRSLPTLQESGADLLRRSRDVWNDEQAHPAYERILSELAPDEGRILMLLLRKGPQPSVDVRTGGPVGMISSRLIAPGLTMIGSRAGLRYPDQVPAYLNNLFRLGLVWFSKEALRDPLEYQVLEAQPDVLDAVHSVRFAKVVRRSIHLTPFGEEFARMTLVEPEYGEVATFPEHATPEASEAAEPPTP